MFRISAALLLVCVAVNQAVNGAWQGAEFVSANRRYFVELSHTSEEKILVAVFHVAKEVKTFHWSRAVEWEEPHPGWSSPSVHEIKALVTNDGNTVVLRDNITVAEKNGVTIVRRASTDDHVVRPFQRRELTGRQTEKHSPGLLRRGVRYLHLRSLFDLVVEDEKSYALWFGQTDQWLLISLENFQQTVVKDGGKLHILNEIARAKAKEMVLQHQPPPLRKMLGVLKEGVGKLVPALATPSFHSYMSGETAAAYLFLATRRFSADRSFINGLVNFPVGRIQRGHAWTGPTVNISFNVTDSERLFGDFLLSRWNGETNREFIAKEMGLLIPQDTFRYLGSIKCDLKFPISVSSTNSGVLWAYIIPAGSPPDEWSQSDDLLKFYSFLARPGPGIPASLGRDGKAAIHGVTPGDYRAKFVWERNRPAGTWRTNVYVGIPGDYESVLTETISVKAGETVENIFLAITNRIRGGL